MHKVILWLTLFLLCACSFEPPEPSHLIIVLDTSSSFAKEHTKVKASIRNIIHRLGPTDQLSFYKLDQEGIVLIRDGISPSLKEFEALFAQHAQVSRSQRKGTAYKLALEALLDNPLKSPCFIAFFGDFADEQTPAGQRLNPDYLKSFANNLGAKTSFFALGVSPVFQLKLMPLKHSLADRFVMLSPEEINLGEQLLLEKMER